MPFGNRKKYFRGSFQISIVTIQKYHPSRNLKFNYLGIFQSLKLRGPILMGKIGGHSIAPKTTSANATSASP